VRVQLYQSLFRDVKRKFNTYANEGTVSHSRVVVGDYFLTSVLPRY
jgi:hypothetical protein